MKNLITKIVLSLVMVFTVLSVNAQKVTVEEKVKKETDALVTALELDEDMAKTIYDISLKHGKEKKEMQKAFRKKKKAGEEVDKTTLKANIKTLYKAQIAAIKEVIGKDKAKAYKDFRKAQSDARKAAKKGE